MSFRGYILFMTLATIIFFVAWIVVLFSVDPYQADMLSFLFFYLSLFFTLVGVISIIGSVLRRTLIKDRVVFRQVITSFRQAILFSCLIIACLFLQGQRLLTWWNILFLISALVMMELFTISRKRTS